MDEYFGRERTIEGKIWININYLAIRARASTQRRPQGLESAATGSQGTRRLKSNIVRNLYKVYHAGRVCGRTFGEGWSRGRMPPFHWLERSRGSHYGR